MAIVQYTAVVNQIRGKLNGSVFNKSRNMNTLGGKQMPRKQSTPRQQQHRTLFGQIQRTWKELTEAQRTAAEQIASMHPVRNRFGEQVYISGYNWFVKANTLRVAVGLPILRMLNPADISTYNFDDVVVQSADLQGTLGSQLIQWDIRFTVSFTSLRGMRMALYVSPPQSAGVGTYHGNYLHVGSTTIESGIPIGTDFIYFGTTAIPATSITYREGETVFVRVQFFTEGNGVTYQVYVLKVVLT